MIWAAVVSFWMVWGIALGCLLVAVEYTAPKIRRAYMIWQFRRRTRQLERAIGHELLPVAEKQMRDLEEWLTRG